MGSNGFRVTSAIKIINRICRNTFEFCGKAAKILPKRCFQYFFI